MNYLFEKSIWLYLIIFFGKIIEVVTETVRIILINRGEKKIGAAIAFFEMMMYIYLVSAVLVNIKEDLIKIIVYISGNLIGYYLGSYFEEKLAIGLSTIEIIIPDNHLVPIVTDNLRAVRLAVTIKKAEGLEGAKKILLVHLKRNRIDETVALIQKINKNLVVTVTDIKGLYGGFIKSK